MGGFPGFLLLVGQGFFGASDEDVVLRTGRVHHGLGPSYVRPLAVACDVRSEALMGDLAAAMAQLREADWKPWLMFLEATDAELVRRFESVRRPHPLQGTGRLLDGIRTERRMLGTLRAAADVVIDTSALNVHQLSARISRLVKPWEDVPHVSTVTSSARGVTSS